jgi:hypothetical protein
MRFYRHNWYYVGGVIFCAMAYFMAFWPSLFNPLQAILLYSFMGMLIHQFEEYGVPGGLPGLANIGLFGERQYADRYPLNANQCMISNVFLTYPFYIIPVFFPNLIWLGLIQIGQGIVQISGHVFLINIRLRMPYNPGMVSNVLLQLPLGIFYIWYVEQMHLATKTDYIIGGIGAVVSMLVLWIGPILLFSSRQSKYPFEEREMYRFGARKLRNLMAQSVKP